MLIDSAVATPVVVDVRQAEADFNPTRHFKNASLGLNLAEIMMRDVRIFTADELAERLQLPKDKTRRLIQSAINVRWIDEAPGGWIISDKLRTIHRSATKSLQDLVTRSIRHQNRLTIDESQMPPATDE